MISLLVATELLC